MQVTSKRWISGVALVLITGACATPSTNSSIEQTRNTTVRQVVIANDRYAPSNINIQRGMTVTWVNRDDEAHTVTSPLQGVSSIDQFDSGVIAPGASYSKTFNLDGRFDYYCRIHPFMRGSVTVSAPSRDLD